jgi:hypothetical protein
MKKFLVMTTLLVAPTLTYAKANCQNVAERTALQTESESYDAPYICTLQKKSDVVEQSETGITYDVYTQCKASGAESVYDMYTVSVDVIDGICGQAKIH